MKWKWTSFPELFEFFKCYLRLQVSGLFDRSWYAAQYPDVARTGTDLLKHYIRYGAREGRNPNPVFNTRFYLELAPDVQASGINPLLHYFCHGRKEGRPISPEEYARVVFHRHSMQVRGDDGGSAGCFAGTAVIIAERSLAQCEKYRVRQTAEILVRLGYRVTVLGWQEFSPAISALQQASLAVFYRVPLNDLFFPKYFAECKRLGVAVAYDIDDPVFDIRSVAANANMDHLGEQIARSLCNDAAMLQVPLYCADVAVVSTKGLKNILQNTGFTKPVIVRRNGLDEETRSLAIAHTRSRRTAGSGPVRLIYATPSRAHQADFLRFEHVFLGILKKYKGDVRLMAVGDLELGPLLQQVSQWVDCRKATAYKDFMALLASVDINLVPLVDNTFNSTKSNIKFLDAGILGIPSVCSPVGDYGNLQDGVSCFLASNEAEWEHKLCTLIENGDLREDMGGKARAYIENHLSLDAVGRELALYLREATCRND